MASRTTYFKGNRCAHCGGIRSDRSALWCIGCVAKYGHSDHTHINQCFNKTSEWFVDKDGCNTRYFGDIDFTKSKVSTS